LADVIGIPLATTHVGKLPRPSWFTYNFEDRDPAEAMAADQDTEEANHDAVKAVLKDQETLGVDIPTDTCLRYDGGDQRTIGNWWTNGICRIGGVRRDTSRPKDAKPVIQSVISREHWREVLLHYPMEASLPTWEEPYVWPFLYIVEDRLSVGKLESSWVNFFEISQRYSTKPVKFSCVDASMGGYMTLRGSGNKHFSNDRDLFFDLCKVYNQVLKALGKAGCKIIQLDTA
jgi:methionine synthase II (cobalamin-independent)